ncbi:MAG TPA: acetyl-CoA carboxylase biotin carboxyl carrier protein subunit [Bryobacteraceae bacterium]|jgi:methylmalonyl-CoA carboxyltransferase small subunit|nr:acetyl-CoA carboxylase biotin carboxyl carrier protein subunit [Bryobacteraceae bacterium]
MPMKPQNEGYRVLLAAAAGAAWERDRPVRLRITLEGHSYEVDVEVLPDSAPEPENEAGMAIPDLVLLPPLLPDTMEDDKICRSPLAGSIVSVTATVGRFLRRDDPVAIIEAMKMQTTVGAPVDGLVEEVEVAPGDSVKPGQMLCRLG